MPGNWHVRFGGAGRGNAPGETPATRAPPDPLPGHRLGRLTQPEPGVLTWHLPHGRSYSQAPFPYRA
jgi:hypothetical protein